MKQNLDQLIAHWQNQRIITAAQAGQMRADIELDGKERNKNRFIMALSTLGALALGAGVILFVSSNWDQLPKMVKLIMAIGLPVLPLCAAYWLLLEKKTYLSLGRGSLIVGMLLIGAAMAIIGQLYHLESEYTRFLLMWSVLALPFAWLFRRPESTMLVATLFGGFLFSLFVDQAEHNNWDGELSLIVFSLVFALYGAVLYGLGRWCTEQKAWHRISGCLRVLGAKVALITFFVMTFEFYSEALAEVFIPGFPEEMVRLILNIGYVIFLIFVLHKALQVQAEKVVSAVFFWFGAFILVRYFDFFWDMLPTSLFFMVGGAIFIGGAVLLERQRKKLLATFTGDSVVHNLDYDE